jgi:hypothetical protein
MNYIRNGNLQAKLDLMKTWSAAKLASKCPIKPRMIKSFKAQLSVIVPDYRTTYAKRPLYYPR